MYHGLLGITTMSDNNRCPIGKPMCQKTRHLQRLLHPHLKILLQPVLKQFEGEKAPVSWLPKRSDRACIDIPKIIELARFCLLH